MKAIDKWTIAIIASALTACLTSCGTEWTVKVSKDGITATPDGPIIIKPTK